MLQIFVPATLVVFISWVSFWINPDSAPSRTVIGTMTILSETHLLTGTNRRLPPVSYIKSIVLSYALVSLAELSANWSHSLLIEPVMQSNLHGPYYVGHLKTKLGIVDLDE
ncbi:unnamed protein product [Anisakis simplex]|uniref:Neur_chan_memb domain-containing protein n=1 Tax=Anisakis simplex TaxID=6269 RepID=A0A0M3J4E5_ANISI|nr:unnamed protein product [Anisakis simplex]